MLFNIIAMITQVKQQKALHKQKIMVNVWLKIVTPASCGINP
jgi:hypothetical protein